MQDHAVEGYEHIEEAAGVLSGVVTDLFALPGAAQDRAIAQREALGEEDHGDDLLCGCWAAAGAATALLELAGRHMDALLHLSGQHPGFASSAEVLARSALEGLFRMSWLLAPENVLDREQRWFALKKEEARFYKNLGQIDQAGLDEWIADLESQAAFVGGDPITGVPSAERLVDQFGRTQLVYDTFYRWTSQSIHGTLVGAGTFDPSTRQDWYGAGGQGEWVEAEFWSMPLAACWEAAVVALPVYRDLLAPDFPLPSLEREDEIVTALRAVPANFQARRDLGIGKARPVESPDRPVRNRAQRRAAMRRERRKGPPL